MTFFSFDVPDEKIGRFDRRRNDIFGLILRACGEMARTVDVEASSSLPVTRHRCAFRIYRCCYDLVSNVH